MRVYSSEWFLSWRVLGLRFFFGGCTEEKNKYGLGEVSQGPVQPLGRGGGGGVGLEGAS